MDRLSYLTSVLVLCCAGCAGSGQEPGALIAPGKADNYFSNVATEYELTGELAVSMTADEFADEQTRERKVQGRLSAVGLYLTAYLTDKFEGIDKNRDGVISEDERFFHNLDYGGFKTMVRNQSGEALAVRQEGDGYVLEFTIDVAGPQHLLSMLPLGAGDGGAPTFELILPEGAEIGSGGVPRSIIRNFDPDTYEGETEAIEFAVREQPTIANAYPAYDEFVADDLFDITLFYGYDYNDARSDLREAREAFDFLLARGFSAPDGVRSFEDLGSESGPFRGTLGVDERDVPVEVRIFHVEMFESRGQSLHQRAIDETTQRDVFFYNGHAGPYVGYYLSTGLVANVSPEDLASANFTDKQQLFVMQGCQTYSNYADMIYGSPAKNEDNADVITTVNFSYGRGTLGILEDLLATDDDSHPPASFGDMLEALNSDYLNRSELVFYGVMGMDGNAQVHPLADAARLGAACDTLHDPACGVAGLCGSPQTGTASCGLRATGDCPEGTAFYYVDDGSERPLGGCFRP